LRPLNQWGIILTPPKKDALWVTDGSEARPYDQVQQLWDQ